MVIPLILGGIARGAALAGRGIVGAGRMAGRGARWGLDPIKNHPASQWVANNPMTQSVVNHPLTQKIVQHPATKIVGGTAGLMGGLALATARAPIAASRGAVNKVSQAELKTVGNFFAGFALLLWIIDIAPLPIFGDVYSGFNFNPQDFWNNWFSKFTLGNAWFDALIIIVAFFIIIKYARERRIPSGFEIFIIFLFSFTMIFFVANPGWMAFPKAILHFVFIILFGFMYIGRLTNMNLAFLSVSGFLFFDFFLFSTVLNTVPVLKYISLLSTIIIALTFGFTPSGFTGTATAFLVVFIVVVSVAEGYITQGVSFQEGEGNRPALAQVFDRFSTGIGKYKSQIQRTLESRIQYAVTGKVEENQFEPLGVTLENVQSADPRYYEDEDVIVWGTVKARTLDDPININVGCFVKKDDKKILADKTDPNKKFSVFTLEEQDFACTFTKDYNKKNNILKPGTNTIKAFADFNFETLAYLKTYFINRERQRAMVREGLDPFEEFAIEDKSPIAVYTNGPAKIEMGTNNPLVSVSLDYIVEPSLDIRIGNREGWQGRINQLEELVLFLPEGIDFNPSLSCNKKFDEYEIIHCRASCTKFVEFECRKVCEGFNNPDEKNRCYSACTERTETCKKTCESFFTEGEQLYKGYALDVTDIRYKDESKDFEKGKLFRCRFKPTAMVLGTSPLTTKSFRVKARYNYTVEKDVSVGIDKLPEDKSAGVPIPSTPTSFIKINNDAATTTSPAVTLLLSCSSQSACTKMKIANTVAGVDSAPEQAYATAIPWTLESGDGLKAVNVKYLNKDGIWSNVYADDIELTTKPVAAPKLG